MRLKRIVLNNFRQFYGLQSMSFAGGDTHNTTVIFGNNGSGKTAILNAFTWALYGQFSPAFGSETLLINKRAVAELPDGELGVCSVELVFEHDGKDYRLERRFSAPKKNGTAEDGEVSLALGSADSSQPLTHRTDFLSLKDDINRFLPSHLHRYFFFDGERIEQIVRSNKRQEIAEATRVLVGVEVINRAKTHLKNAKKELENEMKNIENLDSSLKDAINKNLQRQETLETKQSELDEVDKDITNQTDLSAELDGRLRELQEIATDIKQKDDLDRQKIDTTKRLSDLESDLRATLSKYAYSIFLQDSITGFKELLDQFRKRGELPTPIKTKFVQDLLDRGNCICGSALHNGSTEYSQVAQWLDKAPLENVEESAVLLGYKLESLTKDADSFWKKLDELQEKIRQHRETKSKIETQLAEIADRLRNSPSEDIAGMQRQLSEIQGRLDILNKRHGEIEDQIKFITKEIDVAEAEIAKRSKEIGRAQLASRRVSAAKDAIDRLDDFSKRLGEQFRLQLESKIQSIFGRILVAPYLPKLSADYQLLLVENTSGQELPVPASTGENQVLSLSFILSIIECVRDWKQKRQLVGIDSTTFPMVMDSPFGSLDEVYRRQVASCLPELVSQLVLLVTKTQWRGEVADEMQRRLGRKVILQYYTPKKDVEFDSIELDGKSYPLVKESDEFEYTQILEI